MSDPSYRRLFGLLLGLATGFTFALVSQGINFLYLPGLPLYMPPFGPIANVALGIFVGGIIGLLAAWPENFFLGVLWSSLFGWLLVAVASYFTGQVGQDVAVNKATALLIILIPAIGFLAPLMAVIRWIISREEKASIQQKRSGEAWRPTRLILPLLLLFTAGWVGYTNLYPELGRSAALRMQLMIQQGRQVASNEALPKFLQPPDVVGFREKSAGEYTIEWDPDEKNRYAIPRPPGSTPASAAIARFQNGWLLVCIFTDPDRAPECRGFDELPEFLRP